VNLIGEHTDYCDGFVLPFAIAARAHAAVAVRRDPRLRLHSVQRPEDDADLDLTALPGTPGLGWAAYPAGAVWALREAGIEVPGLDVVIDSDVPMGAGLSSSAAVICATASAAAAVAGADVDPMRLALLGQRAENVVAGVPCGVMDHVASLLARADHAVFLDVRALHVEHVLLPLRQRGLALVVVDTRVRHALADGSYADRRRSTEELARELGVRALRDIGIDDLDHALTRVADPVRRRRLRHVVTENQRVLAAVSCARDGRVADIGALLTQSHASLRDDFEVSVPALDDAVSAALDAGALGARMTGGGFGGSVVALVPLDRITDVETGVRRAARAAGHPEPVVSVERPAAGAHEDGTGS
jgi:galactokinase